MNVAFYEWWLKENLGVKTQKGAQKLSTLVRSLAVATIEQRVALYLLHAANEKGEIIGITQDQIAHDVGGCRSHVATLMADWQRADITRRITHKHLVIADEQALVNIASGIDNAAGIGV